MYAAYLFFVSIANYCVVAKDFYSTLVAEFDYIVGFCWHECEANFSFNHFRSCDYTIFFNLTS